MKEEKLIQKWLDNELTPEEMATLEQLEGFKDYQKIVAAAPHFKAPEFDADKTFAQIQAGKSTQKQNINWYSTIAKIAAVLIVAVLSYTYFFNNSNKEFTTATASTEHIILPDESSARLNAGSFLTYNKDSWEESRNLNLEGEAYFKVAKGKKFSVKTPNGTVSVKGTQFNVKQRENLLIVSCYEGLVEVETPEKTLLVSAGNEFRFMNNTAKLISMNGDEPSWLKGKSSFANIPLKAVFNELERQYDIKVSLKNLTFGEDETFTGSFVHNNLEDALKAISIPFDLSYKINGSVVTIVKREP